MNGAEQMDTRPPGPNSAVSSSVYRGRQPQAAGRANAGVDEVEGVPARGSGG